MEVDDQFRDWWVNCIMGRPSHSKNIPSHRTFGINIYTTFSSKTNDSNVAPKSHAYTSKEMNKDRQRTTTTTRYSKKKADDGFVLVLRQKDTFAISATSPEICNKVRQTIRTQMANELHDDDLGVIKRFNGLDIHQTRDY